MADDNIVVTLEPDPSAAKVEQQEQQPVAKAVEQQIAKSDPVEDLKQQYSALQRSAATEREQLTRRATQAEQAASQARGEIVEHQSDVIATGISAAQAEAESAAIEHQAALEAGDFAKATAAQRKIAKAEARLVRLEEAKDDLETRKTKAKEAPPVETRQQPPTDPVEAYIQGRTEPTARWLREHRDWVTDQNKNAHLTEAHFNAVRSGKVVDTPEYFEHVERYIGLRPAQQDAQQQQRRSEAPMVAPVSAAPGSVNGGGTEVRLSSSEVQSATDGTLQWNYDDPSGQKRFKKGDPIGVQEFARRKAALQAQGAYDKSSAS